MKNEESLSKRLSTKKRTRYSKNSCKIITNLRPNKVLQLTQKYNEILQQDHENVDMEKLSPTRNTISYKLKDNEFLKQNSENSRSHYLKPLLKPKPLLRKPTDLKHSLLPKEILNNLTKLENIKQNNNNKSKIIPAHSTLNSTVKNKSVNTNVNNIVTKEIKENLKPAKALKHEFVQHTTNINNITENGTKKCLLSADTKVSIDNSETQDNYDSEMVFKLKVTDTGNTESVSSLKCNGQNLQETGLRKQPEKQNLLSKPEALNSRVFCKEIINNRLSRFPENSQIKHLKKTPSFSLRNSELSYRSVKTVVEIFERRKSDNFKNSFKICNANEDSKIIDGYKNSDAKEFKFSSKLKHRNKHQINSSTSDETLEQLRKAIKTKISEKRSTEKNYLTINSTKEKITSNNEKTELLNINNTIDLNENKTESRNYSQEFETQVLKDQKNNGVADIYNNNKETESTSTDATKKVSSLTNNNANKTEETSYIFQNAANSSGQSINNSKQIVENEAAETITVIDSTSNKYEDKEKSNIIGSVEAMVCPNNSFLWRSKSRESVRLSSLCTESIYEEIQPTKAEIRLEENAVINSENNDQSIYEDIKSGSQEEISNIEKEKQDTFSIYEDITARVTPNENSANGQTQIEMENLYDPIGNYEEPLEEQDKLNDRESIEIIDPFTNTADYETLSDSNYEDLDYDEPQLKFDENKEEMQVRISLNSFTDIANYSQFYESLSIDVQQSKNLQSDHKDCDEESLSVQSETLKQKSDLAHSSSDIEEKMKDPHIYYNETNDREHLAALKKIQQDNSNTLTADINNEIENNYDLPDTDPDYYNHLETFYADGESNSEKTDSYSPVSNLTLMSNHSRTADYENIDEVGVFQDCILSHNNSLYRKTGWNQTDTANNHSSENEISSNNWVDITDEKPDDLNLVIIRNRYRHKKRHDWSDRVREQWNKNSVDSNELIDQDGESSHFYESLPSDDDTDSFDSESENEFFEIVNQDDSGINMVSSQFLEPAGNSYTLSKLAVSASKQMQRLKNNFSITKNDFTKSLSRITNKKPLKWKSSSTHKLHSKNIRVTRSNITSIEQSVEQSVEQRKRSTSLEVLKDSDSNELNYEQNGINFNSQRLSSPPLMPSANCMNENKELENNPITYEQKQSISEEISCDANDIHQNVELKLEKNGGNDKRKKNWLKLKKNEESNVNRSTFYLATNDVKSDIKSKNQ